MFVCQLLHEWGNPGTVVLSMYGVDAVDVLGNANRLRLVERALARTQRHIMRTLCFKGKDITCCVGFCIFMCFLVAIFRRCDESNLPPL